MLLVQQDGEFGVGLVPCLVSEFLPMREVCPILTLGWSFAWLLSYVLLQSETCFHAGQETEDT